MTAAAILAAIMLWGFVAVRGVDRLKRDWCGRRGHPLDRVKVVGTVILGRWALLRRSCRCGEQHKLVRVRRLVERR